jgi:hypothetical protein
MWHRLRRHPFAVEAHFRHSLVLTYAYPEDVLSPLLPPGLTLDARDGLGFLAIALVDTRGLRPTWAPRLLGQDFFLSGYRIFARLTTRAGRTLRGLRILRSDADRRLMVTSGNLLTHYRYRKCEAQMRESGDRLDVCVRTPGAEADLDLTADLGTRPEAPPPGSPFRDLREARMFAGPLPFTFDYERETHSIVVIEGQRERWDPQPVSVDIRRVTFLERPPFEAWPRVLANAFHVRDVPYRWRPGVLEPLPADPA